jgi:hypothetical protein
MSVPALLIFQRHGYSRIVDIPESRMFQNHWYSSAMGVPVSFNSSVMGVPELLKCQCHRCYRTGFLPVSWNVQNLWSIMSSVPESIDIPVSCVFQNHLHPVLCKIIDVPVLLVFQNHWYSCFMRVPELLISKCHIYSRIIDITRSWMFPNIWYSSAVDVPEFLLFQCHGCSIFKASKILKPRSRISVKVYQITSIMPDFALFSPI